MRNPDHQFIETSAETIIAELTSKYEELTNTTVHPSSPVKIFLSWCAAAILQIYQNINYAANQNLPSRAEGENLDAIAELFFMKKRPDPTPAYVTVRFTISEAQTSTLTIPAGTRVTNANGDPVFETTEEGVIAIGQTTVDVLCVCQDAGTVGNGYSAGQITELIDVFPYYDSCTNIETSDGGSDSPTDDEFYNLLMNSTDAWSCAGPVGAYQYFAKSVSTEVADVVVNSPNPGEVNIYALMEDGTKAGSAVKNLIAAACNDNEVRPLTDTVSVEDPEEVSYDIELTYYMSTESQKSAAEISDDVDTAVSEYQAWQAGRLGRDINPSRLIQMLVEAGAKRVVVTKPTFVHLEDGSDVLNHPVPQLAQVGTVSVTNGGYEDE